MSYSCADFTDEILSFFLEEELVREDELADASDDVEQQADLVLMAVTRLRHQLKDEREGHELTRALLEVAQRDHAKALSLLQAERVAHASVSAMLTQVRAERREWQERADAAEAPALAVVGVEGGVVQWVIADKPVQALIMDMDTDGGADEDVSQLPEAEADGLAFDETEAWLYRSNVDVMPERVKQITDALVASETE